jgi:hypothetical protein
LEAALGKGTDAARETFGSLEHSELIDNLKDQLLIVFLKRLGGTLECDVSEVDDTSQDMFAFSIKDRRFKFEIRKKE